MKYTSLLFSLLLLCKTVFAQEANKEIRSLKPAEFKELQEALTKFEDFVHSNINDTSYEARRALNMSYTPVYLKSSDIKVTDDTDTSGEKMMKIFDYLKKAEDRYDQKLKISVRKRMMDISPVFFDQLRRYYFFSVTTDKTLRWQDTLTVYDTLYIEQDTSFIEQDTSIYAEQDTSVIDSTYSVLRDSLKSRYSSVREISQDSFIVSRIDTIRQERTEEVTFHFTTTNKDDAFSGFKLMGITRPGSKPDLEPVPEILVWWIDLEPEWKKMMRDTFSLEEFPEVYYLRNSLGTRKLYLNGTGISSSEPLSHFSNLQHLDISGTEISDLSPIKDLTSLKSLNISSTNADTLLHLRNLTNLEYLECNNLGIYSIDNLKNLSLLKELYCRENNLRDIEAIKNMPLLEELDISLNYDIQDISPVSDKENLTKLLLRKVEIESLEPLRGLPNLVYLDCFNAGINSLEPISGLKKLMHLDADHNSIESLNPIKNHRFIYHLSVSSTKISDVSIVRQFDNLTHLNISNNPQITNLNGIPNEQLLVLKAIRTGIKSNEIKRFKKRNPQCNITYY